MSCLLIMKIPFLYCNPQFVMKQLGSGKADNGVQCFTDIPLPQYLTLWLVMLLPSKLQSCPEVKAAAGNWGRACSGQYTVPPHSFTPSSASRYKCQHNQQTY